MNRLSQSVIYNKFSKLSRIEELYKKGFEPFEVPKRYYMGKMEELMRFKYPLSQFTRDSIESGFVVPVILDTPFMVNDKRVDSIYDTYPLFYFPRALQVKNNVPTQMVVYGNTFRGDYTRDKKTQEALYYNIVVGDFYGIMQISAVAGALRMKDAKVNSAIAFQKLTAEMFGELFAKAVDGNRKWSISGGSPERLAMLRFLAMVYYFEAFREIPKEKAIEITLSCFNSFDKTHLQTKCKYISSNLNIYNSIFTKRENVKDNGRIYEFIAVISDQFPEISDLTYANLLMVYREMYGDAALFCLEDFVSFVTMLQLVNLQYGVFKDRVISKQFFVEKKMPEFLKLLTTLVES